MPNAQKSRNDVRVLVFATAVACALVFSFFCSISEAVLLSVTHAEVERLGSGRAGTVLRRFKRQIDVPIAAILILNTVANTVGAAVGGATFSENFDAPLWVFSATFTVAVLLFTEIVPKTLGVTFAGRLAAPVAIGVNVLRWILAPAIALTRSVSGLLTRGHSGPVTSLEDIRLLAALGRTEGAVLPRVATIIEGATRLRKLRARDVMVPRTSVAVLSGQRSLEENLKLVRRTGHSRFPFSATGDLDAVDGIVLTKDLMFYLQDVYVEMHTALSTKPPSSGRRASERSVGEGSHTAPPSARATSGNGRKAASVPKPDPSSSQAEAAEESSNGADPADPAAEVSVRWEALLGPPLMVSGATPLDQLLRVFQDERRHLALVLDEYGGAQGIVTLEDVLEEIVGEIEDESDRISPFISRRPDGTLVCSGRAETRKVFHQLGLTATVDSSSLGGFVADQVGRVPRSGDRFEFEGVEFQVLYASQRRAERIAIVVKSEG